jgi:hypothetical protein
MRPTALAFLSLLFAAAAARADVLFLKGGGRVEGVVTEDGDEYVVKMIRSTTRIRKTDVEARQSIPYLTEIYDQKLKRLDPRSADEHCELALWCRARGLTREADELLSRAVKIDPEHKGARRAMGQVKLSDRWLSEGDARAEQLEAAGFRRVEDRFYTAEGLRASLRAQAELAALAAESEKRRLEREAAERDAKLEQELLLKAEAERKAAEAALAQAAEAAKNADRLARENDDLRRLVRELLDERAEDSYYYGWSFAPFGFWPAGGYYLRGGAGGCWDPRLVFRYDGDHFRLRGIVR